MADAATEAYWEPEAAAIQRMMDSDLVQKLSEAEANLIPNAINAGARTEQARVTCNGNNNR